MRVINKFSSYNQRRYGNPWICKITDWETGKQPSVVWGAFYGSGNSGGEVEIDAESGDVVRTGQRDHRGNNTSADWFIVDETGKLISVSAAEARRHWFNRVSGGQ